MGSQTFKMALSKRDLEELRPVVQSSVLKVLGINEPSVVIAAVNCIGQRMSKTKTVGKEDLHLPVY